MWSIASFCFMPPSSKIATAAAIFASLLRSLFGPVRAGRVPPFGRNFTRPLFQGRWYLVAAIQEGTHQAAKIIEGPEIGRRLSDPISQHLGAGPTIQPRLFTPKEFRPAARIIHRGVPASAQLPQTCPPSWQPSQPPLVPALHGQDFQYCGCSGRPWP